jgi:hypothetical protein
MIILLEGHEAREKREMEERVEFVILVHWL